MYGKSVTLCPRWSRRPSFSKMPNLCHRKGIRITGAMPSRPARLWPSVVRPIIRRSMHMAAVSAYHAAYGHGTCRRASASECSVHDSHVHRQHAGHAPRAYTAMQHTPPSHQRWCVCMHAREATNKKKKEPKKKNDSWQ